MEKGDKTKKKMSSLKFFEFNEDGKIVVPDDDKNNNSKSKLDSAKLKDEVEAFLRGGSVEFFKTYSLFFTEIQDEDEEMADDKPKGKRKREKVVEKVLKAAEEDKDDKMEEEMETDSSRKFKEKDTKSKKKVKGEVQKSNFSGDQFKSSKGEGDGKKGKLDPFAYVPLDPRMTNKRYPFFFEFLFILFLEISIKLSNNLRVMSKQQKKARNRDRNLEKIENFLK